VSGAFSIGNGGNGGFGGGSGAGVNSGNAGAYGGSAASTNDGIADEVDGGGGAGLGGAIFVRGSNGATLTIRDISESGSTVTAGNGHLARDGQTAGSFLFALETDVAFEVSNGQVMTIQNDIADSEFAENGSATSSRGGIIKQGDGTLVLQGSNTYGGGTRIEAGTLQISDTQQLGTGGVDMAGGTLDLASTTQLSDLDGELTVTQNSTLHLQSGAAFSVDTADGLSGTATLSKTGSGTLSLNQSSTAFSGELQIAEGSASILNAQALGSGGLTVGSGASVSLGQTTLNNNAVTLTGGTLFSPTGLDMDSVDGIQGNGTVFANLSQGSAKLIQADGALALGNPGSTSGYAFQGTLDVGAQDVTLMDADAADLGSSTTLAGGSLTSSNGITLGAGEDLSGFGEMKNSFTNDGTVTGSGAGLEFSGIVDGSGDFLGEVTFSGIYSPGNSPAQVTLGNARFENVLQMELGGTTAGTEYDQILGGNLNLGGQLQISYIDGYSPTIGDSFLLLDAASLNGSFDSFVAPDSEFWVLTEDSSTGEVSLAFIPEPSGLILVGLSLIALLAVKSISRRSR